MQHRHHFSFAASIDISANERLRTSLGEVSACDGLFIQLFSKYIHLSEFGWCEYFHDVDRHICFIWTRAGRRRLFVSSYYMVGSTVQRGPMVCVSDSTQNGNFRGLTLENRQRKVLSCPERSSRQEKNFKMWHLLPFARNLRFIEKTRHLATPLPIP